MASVTTTRWQVRIDSAGHKTEVHIDTGARREHVCEWEPTMEATGQGIVPGWCCVAAGGCMGGYFGSTHPDERTASTRVQETQADGDS